MEHLNNHSIPEHISEIIEKTSSLRELTYSYIDLGDGKNFNETIFIDYLRDPFDLTVPGNLLIALEQNDFFPKLISTTGEKLQSDITDLKKYQSLCDKEEKNNMEMLIAALEFTLVSLEFECESAGYSHNMSQGEIEEKTHRLYELDSLMFGEHISENLDFLKETYAYLKYLASQFGGNLGTTDYEQIQDAIDILEIQINKISGGNNIISTISPYVPESESDEFGELKNIKISREDYIEIFDAFFSVSGVTQRSKEGNFGSFYDGDEFYGVPENEGYDSKTLYELLKLAPHETGHYVNLKVTQDRGDVKHVGDMIKEEGLAKLTEKLISGISIESMNAISFSAPSVVLARLLPGEKFLNFQDTYGTLLVEAGIHSSKRDVTKEFLRKKRGFSKKYPGGSNKDASYSLGLFSVMQYIKNGEGSIANLFGGKISMDEVKTGKFLPEGYGNHYISHIILAELIFFHIKNREKIQSNNRNFHEEFVDYLKEKYQGLSDSFELFSQIERFTFSNKRKVIEILKIVDASMDSGGNKNETSQNS